MKINDAVQMLLRTVKDLKAQSTIPVSGVNNGLATPKLLESFIPITEPIGTNILTLENGFYKIDSPINGPQNTGGAAVWLIRVTGYAAERVFEAHLVSQNRHFTLNLRTGMTDFIPKLWQEITTETILWRGSIYKKGSTIKLLDSLTHYSKVKIQFNMFGNIEERTIYTVVSNDPVQFNNTVVPNQMTLSAINIANSIPKTNAMNTVEFGLQCNSDKTAVTLNYVNPHTTNLDASITNNSDFGDAVQILTITGVR